MKNQLLAALPIEEYQNLAPHLESVELPLRQVLHEAGEPIEYVYFPTEAMISLVSIMKDGSTVEVALIGKEGMVGIPVILGGNSTTSQAVVQVAGRGLRLQANILKAQFQLGGQLHYLLLRYIQALFTQISQGAVCNRLHNLEERLARWLLSVQDCLQMQEFPMTQEHIAQMLGSRRSGVTVAAGMLQHAGIISYRRGRINILSRERLEATSCECYGIIKAEIARLLNK
ncbi:MAG: Crp/Fnr family transcriptional regulator [Scytonematopsis contorta HA4267-MV1]|nr:Crp/Fnr family transcriptional regulator [Scytonematopsis contorta HA4267-MV1]